MIPAIVSTIIVLPGEDLGPVPAPGASDNLGPDSIDLRSDTLGLLAADCVKLYSVDRKLILADGPLDIVRRADGMCGETIFGLCGISEVRDSVSPPNGSEFLSDWFSEGSWDSFNDPGRMFDLYEVADRRRRTELVELARKQRSHVVNRSALEATLFHIRFLAFFEVETSRDFESTFNEVDDVYFCAEAEIIRKRETKAAPADGPVA